jgi:hypothetical protein
MYIFVTGTPYAACLPKSSLSASVTTDASVHGRQMVKMTRFACLLLSKRDYLIRSLVKPCTLGSEMQSNLMRACQITLITYQIFSVGWRLSILASGLSDLIQFL